jgi:transposase
MLNLPRGVRVFMATRPRDFRRSYDGLCALVEGEMSHDARSGDLYVFLNLRATQVKILFWDRDGYCILAKRLEVGTFRRLSSTQESPSFEIEPAQLVLLLDGIDTGSLVKRKRFHYNR